MNDVLTDFLEEHKDVQFFLVLRSSPGPFAYVISRAEVEFESNALDKVKGTASIGAL